MSGESTLGSASGLCTGNIGLLPFVRYNLAAIEQTVHAYVSAPTDISFLISHFRELPEEAQQYLIWASIFSPTFVCMVS